MNVQVLAKFPLLQALDWAQYKLLLLLPHHHQTTSVEKKIGGLVNDETPRFPHQPPQKYHQTTSVEKKIGGVIGCVGGLVNGE